MKPYNIGLFVGKFNAYHKGHQKCINLFSEMCNKLQLVLCSKKEDPVPYKIKKQWLDYDIKYNIYREIKNDNINLLELNEDHIKPYPEGLHQWCQEIQKLVGPIDVMFGNDNYVKECAEILNCHHYIPDENREEIQISSTRILKNQLRHYEFLNTVSKPYFNKKVLITGGESTGKSTLCKLLAQHYKGLFVEEYGRTYEEETYGNQKDIQWKMEDFEIIADIHNQDIEKKMSLPSKIVFVDTDALITEIFSTVYIRETSKKLQNMIKNQHFDLIIMLDYEGTDHVDDGTRLLGNHRQFINSYIKFSLDYYKKDYIVINNNNGYDHRFEEVKFIIDTKFKLI